VGKFPSLDGRGLRGGCDKQFIRTASLPACLPVRARTQTGNAQAGKNLQKQIRQRGFPKKAGSFRGG